MRNEGPLQSGRISATSETTDSAAVWVRVLGDVAIELNGSAMPLPKSLGAVALLGWLAIHPGTRLRAEIASSLWPDVADASARGSVRSALWSLRQALNAQADFVLDTSRHRIGLRNVSVDYRCFEELVAAGQIDDALALTSGELLTGLNHEWAMLARETHRDRLIALLAASSDAAAADGDHVVATARARAAMDLNPLSESAARLLMHRYVDAGDRSVALDVYRRIVARLRRELKIAPSQETCRLAQSIRMQNPGPPHKAAIVQNLPMQLTSFVGREAEISEVRQLLADHRLVTLTGAGGVGKTRLAVQIATQIVAASGDAVCYVDLAPIVDPDLVPLTVAHAFGLPDQAGRSTMNTLTHFIADRHVLVVLDNCEHLLDATAALIAGLLGKCPRLTVSATSREPIGVAGEVIRRVPCLSVAGEAVELFTDRARQVRPDFTLTNDNAAAVTEICVRLDGLPLAIELAAARVRALSLGEIADGLHDRFRLLTGGARTLLRRQQTLRASVDWSHALLTQPEQVQFRRLGVFMGGFDLDAAHAVATDGDLRRDQVLDQLTLLIDKSLVVAEDIRGHTRYRLLETMRQYALEKLVESGQARAVGNRHRDHYTALAARLDTPPADGFARLVDLAVIEIGNLRAAFTYCRENDDTERAMQLASSLQPLWATRGRLREGSAWFDAVLTAQPTDHAVASAVRARALADRAGLDAMMRQQTMEQAEQAVAIARDIGDSALLARALTSCCAITTDRPHIARPYFTEAIALAQSLGDRWMLSDIHGWQAYGAIVAGDPIAARAVNEQGGKLADAIGDGFNSRRCRAGLGWAQIMQGELASAVAQFDKVLSEAEAAQDVISLILGHMGRSYALAYQGETRAALAAAGATVAAAAEVGGLAESAAHAALATAAVAAGDVVAAQRASEVIIKNVTTQGAINVQRMAQVALADRDVVAARRWADEAVSTTAGWHHMLALTTRARVARANGEDQQAKRDIQAALACGAVIQARVGVADILECLAQITCDCGDFRKAASLVGAAERFRECIGEIRFSIDQASYEASITTLRKAMTEHKFACALTDGATLSPDEAVTYALGDSPRP